MKINGFRRATALAVAMAGVAVGTAAQGAIVSASITGGTVLGSGSVVKLGAADTPFSVGFDSFNTDNLYMFDEQQDVALTSDLKVTFKGAMTMLAKGTLVRSHLIAFDPLATQTVRAVINFDGDIIGVARTDAQLLASNYLGLSGVNYLTPTGFGLEPGLDFLAFSGPQTLTVRLGGASPSDVLRVFTIETVSAAVPEPTTWALALAGLGTVGFAMRKRRRTYVSFA